MPRSLYYKVGRTARYHAGDGDSDFRHHEYGGAGAVQDTYTLLRKGIRKLLKTAGWSRANGKAWRRKSPAWWQPILTRTARPPLTTVDPTARAEQLKVLAADRKPPWTPSCLTATMWRCARWAGS